MGVDQRAMLAPPIMGGDASRSNLRRQTSYLQANPNRSRQAVNDTAYASSSNVNKHLAAEKLQQEARINRQSRWVKEQAQSRHPTLQNNGFFEESRNSISGYINAVANSKFISGINRVGEAIATNPLVETFNTTMNPIVVGSMILNEAEQLFQQGDMLNASAGAILAAVTLIPGEALAMNELRMGATLLRQRLGMWGGRERLASGEASFLSKARLLNQSDLYNPGVLSDRQASTFIGGRYKSYQLTDDFLMYRAGSSSKSLGQFLSFEKPISELQARIDKAILPIWPDGGVSAIDTGFVFRVPTGMIVHIGDIANQGGIFLGGTRQIVIEKSLLNNLELLNNYPLHKENLWLNMNRMTM